jgi:omega-amidase
MTINAAAVQFDVQKGRIQANIGTVLNFLEQLALDNVQLAVLPEMFSCSFDNENLPDHSRQTDQIVKTLSGFAKQHHMALAGSLPRMEGGSVYNEMFFIDTDGKCKAGYRKMHLFRLTGEHHYYTSGDRIVCIDTSLGRIGLMICYDLRFPELARSLFLDGAQMLLVSAQWPAPRKEQWQLLLQARAIENQLFVIGANRTGSEDDLIFPGKSLIADPFGNILDDAGAEDGTATARIDFKQVKAFRRLIPCRSDRREDIYG